MGQREVAELVGASRPAVGGWEIRGLAPAREFMPKVIEFLGHLPATALPPGDLVKQLTAVRCRLRLPRSEVAEILGLSYGTIHAWETGQRRPRGRSLALLREFLGVHPEGEVEGEK